MRRREEEGAEPPRMKLATRKGGGVIARGAKGGRGEAGHRILGPGSTGNGKENPDDHGKAAAAFVRFFFDTRA